MVKQIEALRRKATWLRTKAREAGAGSYRHHRLSASAREIDREADELMIENQIDVRMVRP